MFIKVFWGEVKGEEPLATPQFSFLDLGREGAGGRAFPHPEQGTYPLW